MALGRAAALQLLDWRQRGAWPRDSLGPSLCWPVPGASCQGSAAPMAWPRAHPVGIDMGLRFLLGHVSVVKHCRAMLCWALWADAATAHAGVSSRQTGAW